MAVQQSMKFNLPNPYTMYLMERKLKSDGQQFHQYQQNQNQQLPLTSNHWTQKKTMTYMYVVAI